MTCIHLATALVRREDSVLLVASTYPNHELPLWNLPGGRQQHGELLEETVRRELYEETGMQGNVRDLCYVSESYNAEIHFTNFTFAVDADGEPTAGIVEGDHIVESRWVHIDRLHEIVQVPVVRDPLLTFLRGSGARYAGYAEAGISIIFPD